MDGRPAGRGRGRARGGPVEPQSLEPAPGPAPTPVLPPDATITPEVEIVERLEAVAVESDRDASAQRPVAKPAGRSRGRGAAAAEPISPGRPAEVPRVVAQPIEQVYDAPGSEEPVVTLQTEPLEVTPSQPVVAAAEEVAPAQVEVAPATGTSASGSGHVAKEGDAKTAKGSDSFPTVYLNKGLTPVVRKGEKGEKVNVATNFIRVKLGSQRGMYEYRVEFDPPVEAMDVRKKALRKCSWIEEKPFVFDGQTLDLSEALESDTTQVDVENPVDPSTKIRLTIKFIKKKSMLDSVQFYNNLIKRIQKELGFIELGRNFYDPRVTHQIPQHKLEIFPGVVTRIDEVEGGLMLCLDASNKIIRHDTALDIWNSIKAAKAPDPKELYKETMMGKMVVANYGTLKVYRVDDISWDVKPSSTFTRRTRDGEIEMSYADYYKKQYGLNITDSNQPVLLSRPKARRSDKPGEVRQITLIPEFCRMSGLTDDQIRDFKLMKDCAQYTRLSPQQRFEKLTEFLKKVQECPGAKKILDDWGLAFESGLLRLDGRIVGAPSIEINSRLTMKPAKADFGREVTSNACYRPVPLRRFLVFSSQRDRAKAESMVNLYKQVCGPLGFTYGTPGEVIPVQGNGPNDFLRALNDYAHQDKVQFIIVLLPFPRDDVYSAIKRFCVVEKSIPSQVILSKTLNNEKNQRSVMQKVALQINCKLGGALWSLKIPMSSRIMFVGMDVYHDPKRKSPSVMALVAAMDTSCTKYYSRVMMQAPHKEVSMDSLVTLFVEALEEFRTANENCFPDRIIVFRDGVSDGQWEHVKETEIQQIKKGIQMLHPDSPIAFTFCVVQKKINERFFTVKGNRYENPVPGAVLDHTVNRRYYYDFFLVPQLVRQGTVSPTHFIILEDSPDTKPDLIQKFAYASTFMYFNWCGTIRVPAMCQYAHKLAYLTGQHLKKVPNSGHHHTLFYL